MKPICIVADLHERRSAVPAELERLGNDVIVRQLAIGDYDVGAGTLIERKSAQDLVLSLRSGRLWRQVGLLRRKSRFPVLLLEGNPLEDVLGPVPARGLTLAIADQGIVFLTARDAVDSAKWITSLAVRRQRHRPRDRPPYTYRRRLPTGQPGEALLCAIRGISVHHARALLDAFGSVRGVVEASPNEWQSVRGIGPARARAMSVCFGVDEPN